MIPRRPAWLTVVTGIVIIVVLVGGWLVLRDYLFESSARSIRSVAFPGGEVVVDIAVTPSERQAGLSGRASLPPDSGMLFIYRDTRPRRFTMRGMLFDLDIITLDSSGRVVGVQRRETGESGFDLGPACYVLEVPAGWAESHGVGPGQKATFVRENGS